ncbi:hypothetical protein [Rufibacter hautae]|uniref:CPBP family intramembrane metalloprotease n=1 Tax=Rufibacter hautae TaxID=2595005 RepID=A0A5B6TM78_9BACT|nr:hypothetical protein [Rufibacter hautae]KAA3440505.1 hypothetical protein FOA19_07590 [Rufibacter hautae]
MHLQRTKSLFTFFFFLLLVVLTFFWGQRFPQNTPNLRLVGLDGIGWLMLALPFLWLQPQAGLPNIWEPTVNRKQRIWLPVAIGLVFGALDILVVKMILHPDPYTELPPFLQPFPYSIGLYFSGALYVEVFYRLVPITLVLLLEQIIWRGKYAHVAFWGIATLSALREPLEQFPDGAWWFIVYSFGSGFAFNFLQALYLKKAGFLATLLIRLSHYLLWHILLGVYVEYVELAP